MMQEQHIKTETSIAIRIWLYISRPFQITKILEILYMLDWLWYAILSFLPDKYITDSLFTMLHIIFNDYQLSAFFSIIALLHMVALYNNIVWMRKLNLLFNIGLLLYLTGILIQRLPIAAGLGYLVILISISIFAFWRMDETQ